MIEARKFTISDFLAVAIAFALLFVFFTVTVDAQDFRITREVAFTISRIESAPLRSAACNCLRDYGEDCQCETKGKAACFSHTGDGGPCRAHTGAATVSSARAATSLAAVAPTYTAAQGRWVRFCGQNGCQMVWEPAQQAARTEPQRQSYKPQQRRGLFGGRLFGR